MVKLEDFKKLELIVAQIKEVKEHPNADRLYVLKVDTGKEVKQLVAGIRKAYSKEELIGRRIVIVNNLEPALIRGEESQGMILAASDENNLWFWVYRKISRWEAWLNENEILSFHGWIPRTGGFMGYLPSCQSSLWLGSFRKFTVESFVPDLSCRIPGGGCIFCDQRLFNHRTSPGRFRPWPDTFKTFLSAAIL